MKLNIKLSTESIENAIQRLIEAEEDLMQDVGETVDILLYDGENVANDAYGSMATAWGHRDQDGEEGIVTGHIGVSGDDEDTVYIAEFGAGDDTMEETGFELPPPVPVYAGSYSELKGSGEYASKGYWYFGGQKYYGDGGRRVEPRHGLLNAKLHILTFGNDIAREVILHD